MGEQHSLAGEGVGDIALHAGGPSSVDYFYFWGMNMKQRSCDGRGARSAPFGQAMSPKKRVRVAHGRAREAKIH
jgi:hypothetical protein